MMKFFFRIIMILLAVIVIAYASLWIIGRRTFPVASGITFMPGYVTWLGLDWKDAYKSILSDLKPKYIRLSARWDVIEAVKGEYDYSELDFTMNEAARHGVKVLLVVGEKIPRWPECFVPAWAKTRDEDSREHFFAYVKKTVKRYRDHSALELWQVENEPFIKFDFGDCQGYDPANVSEEIAVARGLDREHKIVVTDSGELGLWWRASRAGDIFGTTVYRVVLSHGFYSSYAWMPAGFYLAKARILGIPYERFFVAELQAEPWLAGNDPRTATVEEAEKSLSPDRLRANLDFATHVGASRSYLWGAEWWYYMKTVRNDSSYWDIVKERIQQESETQKKLEIRN